MRRATVDSDRAATPSVCHLLDRRGRGSPRSSRSGGAGAGSGRGSRPPRLCSCREYYLRPIGFARAFQESRHAGGHHILRAGAGRPAGDPLGDALHHARQRRARPDLDERVAPEVVDERADRRRPAHRRGELAGRAGRATRGRRSCGPGVDVGNDGRRRPRRSAPHRARSGARAPRSPSAANGTLRRPAARSLCRGHAPARSRPRRRRARSGPAHCRWRSTRARRRLVVRQRRPRARVLPCPSPRPSCPVAAFAAASMAAPRAATSRAALSMSSTPAATNAEYSPRLWPACATTVSASSSAIRKCDSTTISSANVAIWARSVRLRVSSSASSRSETRSCPETSEMRSTAAHASTCCHGAPMPARCEPCPENSNPVRVMRSDRIAQAGPQRVRFHVEAGENTGQDPPLGGPTDDRHLHDEVACEPANGRHRRRWARASASRARSAASD